MVTEKLRPQTGPQWDFLASRADIAIMGGAAGGGKTFGLLLGAARHISVPNYAGLLLRRETTQIRNPGGLWHESMEIYHLLGGKPRQSPVLEWNWPHIPASIQFSHLQRENTVFSYLGAQIGHIAFDELITFLESQFWYMISRNRTTAAHSPRVRATTNPDADSFVASLIEWWIDQDSGYPIDERSGVLRWFVRVGDILEWADRPEDLAHHTEPDGTPIEPKSLTFIPAKLEDNPALMKADPGYRANLLALGTVERERLLKGNWKIRPAAGMYFQRDWVEMVRTEPEDLEVVRGWDLAATEARPGSDPDWTVGLKLGKSYSTGRYYILHAVWLRAAPHGVKTLLQQITQADGPTVRPRLPQDPAQAGKWQVPEVAKALDGYAVEFENPTGSKLLRFSFFSAQCQAGNVSVLEGNWNKRLFDELENFPPIRGHDDAADAASTAYHGLTARRAFGVSGRYGPR